MGRGVLGFVFLACAAHLLAAEVEPRVLLVGVWPNRVRFLDEEKEEFVSEMTLRYGAVTNVFGSDRTPDFRRFFFVTDRMEAVEIADVARQEIVGEIKLSSPERRVRMMGAAPNPAGTELYLTVEVVGLEVDRFLPEAVDVMRYDLESGKVIDSFQLPSEIEQSFLPPLIRVSSDGKLLYVFAQDLFLLDPGTREIVDRIVLTKPRAPGYPVAGLGFAPVEAEPGVFYGIFKSPDPVLNKTLVGIARVDVVRREVDTFEVGPDAPVEWLGLSPDGKRAYLGLGDLIAVDLESRRVVARKEGVEQGRQNTTILVSADGKKLFVAGVGPSIDVIDAGTLETLRKIPAGGDIMNPPQPIPRSVLER